MRGWPNSEQRVVTESAVTVHAAITDAAQLMPAEVKADARGVSWLRRNHGCMPVMTSAVAMYSAAAIVSVTMTPNGMSLRGLRTSSERVVTESNPM